VALLSTWGKTQHVATKRRGDGFAITFPFVLLSFAKIGDQNYLYIVTLSSVIFTPFTVPCCARTEDYAVINVKFYSTVIIRN